MSALTTRPVAFPSAVEVHADGLYADLDVQVASGAITATATGEDADSIRAAVDGGTLRITGGPAHTSTIGGVTVTGSGTVYVAGSVIGGGVYTDGGTVTINGVRIDPAAYRQRQRPRVQVTVSEGTPVTLTGVHGHARIGDTLGNLAVLLAGHTSVSAGRVAALGARITGSGDVTVGAVAGEVTAQVVGSGDVHITTGYAPLARLTVTGSGDITFGGTAEHAQLAVTGSGDVYLAHALTPPTRQQAGSGDIRVGRIGGAQ